MGIINISFADTAFLEYDKTKVFFNEKTNILKISYNAQIDFTTINKFIDSSEFKPNIYGLYTKRVNEIEWSLRYIGQRKAKDIKQRLYQHLIKKHQNTGAQLEKVNQALSEGFDIGLKLIAVFPDELRHYYEAKLLQELDVNSWNRNK